MAGKQVGLDYFNDPANIGYLPTDPEIIARLQAGETIDLDGLMAESEVDTGDNMDVAPEGTDSAAAVKGDDAQAATGAVDPDAAQELAEAQGEDAESDGDEKGDGKAAGVATPSGKGVIPYAVLKGTRERAERLQQSLAQAQARIAELEAGGGGAAQDVGSLEEVQGSIGELESMIGDLDPDENPESRKLVETMGKALRGLTAQVAHIAGRIQHQDESAQTAQKETTAEAMAEVPSLLLWQAKHPQVFDQAINIDDALRALPAWRGKPMAERFAEVARQVRMAMPDAPIAPNDPAFQPATNALPTKESVELAAAKKLAAAEQTEKALTLSDLQGGAAGEVDGSSNLSRLENASSTELAAMMAGMSGDKLDEFLANLGRPQPRAPFSARARTG